MWISQSFILNVTLFTLNNFLFKLDIIYRNKQRLICHESKWFTSLYLEYLLSYNGCAWICHFYFCTENKINKFYNIGSNVNCYSNNDIIPIVQIMLFIYLWIYICWEEKIYFWEDNTKYIECWL